MKTKVLLQNMASRMATLRVSMVAVLMAVTTVTAFGQNPATVVDIIVGSEDHTTLEQAVTDAQLVSALSGAGPFTVFAPTDDAFAALPDSILNALLADPTGDLADILQYHVVDDQALSTDLSNGTYAPTLNGDSVYIRVSDSGVFIDNARVTTADLQADNGVVHVIDAVITPSNTVLDVIANSDIHSTLETALQVSALDGALIGEGPFTVFGPTDAAFTALPDGVLDALLADPEGALADILLYHVVSGQALSTDLNTGTYVPTLNGDSVYVRIDGAQVFIDNAEVTVADLPADNGVVHVIDAVITPSNTVWDVIANSEDHTTLETAVQAAKLDGALIGEGPFTVFAPTDDAFAALPSDLLQALLADPEGDLAEILLYHVVSGTALSSDLSDGQYVITLNGTSARVSIEGDMVMIDSAMVTVANIETANGVVHVIDAVITPPTIIDIVAESPVHTTLETAVGLATDVAAALSGDGPFTLFAPTDDAFAALPEGLLDTLVANPEGLLAYILTYHAVGSEAPSSSLSDGDMITTLAGEDVKVTIAGGRVFINSAEVIIADIQGTNGVVHVIDAVLTPPSDIQVAENDMYGTVLTDAYGRTLYFFSPDADGSSMCMDGCLDNWPVFYANMPTIGMGLDENDFASIDRGSGVMQTTYKGWPLYYFVNDTIPGEANGEGLAGKWFVAKPDYSIMIVDNQLTGNDGNNYLPDYTVGDSVIQYFVDAYGNTLYTFVNDNFNKNNFTQEDFSNNNVWPIYESDMVMAIPSTLDMADFGTIDVFGRSQVTYKGNPLYFFGQDAARGETKGVSVPSPGIWPVARQATAPASFATVVDIVVNSEVHTTLEAAVIAAGLADDLSGDGPFTVFAPTDAAFEALPEGLLDDLLADPTGELAQILLYHVVSGAKAMSTDLSDGQMITTMNGDSVMVKIDGSTVMIDDATVTVADIEADNGVVHVIDAVLVPTSTVVDIIVGSPDHTTLEAAVIAAELADDLSGEGPFTVFAPTDAAFAALPEGTVEALLEDPTGELAQILLYHVVSGAKAMSTDLTDGQTITTMNGAEVTVTIDGSTVMINDAMVTVADLVADNGVVHVIDAVLLPATGIEDEILENLSVSVFPNPASELVNIRYDVSESGELRIAMYDMIGQQVRYRDMGTVFEGSYTVELPVSDLKAGLYILTIETAGGQIANKVRIVK